MWRCFQPMPSVVLSSSDSAPRSPRARAKSLTSLFCWKQIKIALILRSKVNQPGPPANKASQSFEVKMQQKTKKQWNESSHFPLIQVCTQKVQQATRESQQSRCKDLISSKRTRYSPARASAAASSQSPSFCCLETQVNDNWTPT